MVRQPLIWVGLDDIGKAFELNIEMSPELGAHRALVTALVAAFPKRKPFSAHEVIDLYREKRYPRLVNPLHPIKEALLELHAKDPEKEKSVGHALSKACGRGVEVGGGIVVLRKNRNRGVRPNITWTGRNPGYS